LISFNIFFKKSPNGNWNGNWNIERYRKLRTGTGHTPARSGYAAWRAHVCK